MSDTSLNTIIQYGTAAERVAFVPTPAIGSQVLYIWFETDNPPDTYVWDSAAWVQINPAGGGGDVVGPVVAVDESIAVFDGTTGKLIKDGGATIADVIALIPPPAITELTGDVTAGPGSGSQAATLASAYKTQTIGITVDGAGAVLTTGIKGYRSFPVNGTIIKWRLLADVAGNIEFDVFLDAFASYPPTTSIVAVAPPELVGVDSDEDSVLTGWTTAIAAGEVLGFEITGVPATITRVTLELTILLT